MIAYTSPETELLLLCATPGESDGRAERIRELAGESLDWPKLEGIAAGHSLTPLLYRGLKAACPDAISAALARSFHDNTAHSLRLTGDLFQVMDGFEREGIRVLPFKGPSLAMTAYGNLALRQFVDLDLLVHKEDALRARELLLAQGYRTDLELDARWTQAYLETYDEFGQRGPDGDPLVELHWAIAPRYFSVPLGVDELWDRAVPVEIGKRRVATLCPDDLLLVLCLHGAKHCWPRVSMACDVAWLITACPIDWEAVWERARRLGSQRMLLVGAELASAVMDVALPEMVSRHLAGDGAARRLAAEVAAGWFASRAGKDRGAGRIMADGWFHLRARERWRDRTRYFFRMATATGVEDWQAADLPGFLGFLYPMLRFPRLLRKYGARIP